jgi:hypothetical protein
MKLNKNIYILLDSNRVQRLQAPKSKLLPPCHLALTGNRPVKGYQSGHSAPRPVAREYNNIWYTYD